MKEPVLFIAGGIWQKPFAKYLKDKGHHVSVVNPVVTDTTILADTHVVADVNDLEAIDRHIANITPAFVTSDQSDISTHIVAKLSQKWGLPGNSTDVIEKFTNKYVMYDFSRSIGVPVPKTKAVKSTCDIVEFAAINGYPVIIKPTDATMSRGFHKFNSATEVNDLALQSSMQFSKSKTVIVQTFVDGNMITLEGVCSGGKHRTIATSLKDGFFEPGINTGVRYPCSLSSKVVEEIVRTNDCYVEKSGMKFGLTHSEYIVGNDGYFFIEIGARGGGAGIVDKIVPWVSGINVYDVLYSSLIGEVVDVKSIDILKRHALLKYYREKDVAKCNEEMAASIRKLPGVADFQFNFIGKQYVKNMCDTRHSMGIFLGESESDLRMVIAKVHSVLNPRV